MAREGGWFPRRCRIDESHAGGGADRFERIAGWAVRTVGCRWGFRLAIVLIASWAAAGPFVHYHDSWATAHSVIVSSVTFLLIFLVQNSQNRELKAVQLKLDELIFAAKNARNELINIEHLSEEQLDLLGHRYAKVADSHHRSLLATIERASPAAPPHHRERPVASEAGPLAEAGRAPSVGRYLPGLHPDDIAATA